MSGYCYVAIWPIEDLDRPMSQLIAEAGVMLSMMTANEGIVITGEPEWTISDERLMCRAPAKRWDFDFRPAIVSRAPSDVSRLTSGKALPSETVADMRRLVEFGHPDREVAERLGVTSETVRRYRKRWAAA